MGIYIEGMKMPKSCGYCPLRHEARDGDECYLGASLTEYQKRPDDCPLVPVPPHGRLIDADELCNRLEKAGKIKPYLESGLNVAISFALTAPTIIPAEEDE
jgi:hypothetical protein